MSYCVNCGVKLKENTISCPLCDCPVINPYEEFKKFSGENPPPMPPKDEAPIADWRDLIHFIMAITLSLAALTCGIVNLCINGSITWSVLPIVGCIAFYVMVCLPIKKRKTYPELFVLYDFFAVAFTITVIAWKFDGFDWALRIAYPLAFAASVCAAYMAFLIRRHKIRYFRICALGAIFAGALSVLTELLLNGATNISWSGIAAISCAGVSAVLCIIAKSRRLSRRFHI